MQSNTIDVSGISSVRLLAALHQRAQYKDSLGYNTYRTPMTEERARIILDSARYHQLDFLDYVEGKILGLKINIKGAEPSFGERLDPVLYNAYNGAGAAEEVIRWLYKAQDLSSWYEQIGVNLPTISQQKGPSLFLGQ